MFKYYYIVIFKIFYFTSMIKFYNSWSIWIIVIDKNTLVWYIVKFIVFGGIYIKNATTFTSL